MAARKRCMPYGLFLCAMGRMYVRSLAAPVVPHMRPSRNPHCAAPCRRRAVAACKALKADFRRYTVQNAAAEAVMAQAVREGDFR